MPEVEVKWIDKLRFVGVDSHKQSVIMSSHDEENSTGMSPSDMLMIALGGCSAIDVVSIMKKKRQDMTGLTINISGDKDADPPWAYRKIDIEWVFHGRNLNREACERSVELAETKYCPVRVALRPEIEVTNTIRIEEEGT